MKLIKGLALCLLAAPTSILANECDNWKSDAFWLNADAERVVNCLSIQNLMSGEINGWTTPLQIAAGAVNNPAALEELIRSDVNIDAVDMDGNTALHIAARFNANEQVIATLINAGVPVDARNSDGQTALLVAAWGNPNPAVIVTLASAGADMNVIDANGRSALHIAAAFFTYPDVVVALIDAGTDVKMTDSYGNTAFDSIVDNSKAKNSKAYNMLQINS
ncbi:MAG: ankyrin repeat domain-containing protein [Alphaproteobacteria bacterium]